MKIELEYPYNKDWRLGYLVTNPENRKTVILFNSSKHRSSTSYARYLMAVSLGRYLEEHEHVDHIDNDRTNDVLSNLQILSQADNTRKSAKTTYYNHVCPICGKAFILSAQRSRPGRTCSRSCGGKKSHMR